MIQVLARCVVRIRVRDGANSGVGDREEAEGESGSPWPLTAHKRAPASPHRHRES